MLDKNAVKNVISFFDNNIEEFKKNITNAHIESLQSDKDKIYYS